MTLEDGLMLYHGSYVGIERIDLSRCSLGKDFGKGFYLTEDEQQAKSFIKTSLLKAKSTKSIPENQNFGYVSAFRYRKPRNPVPTYRFELADKCWLWFVSMNRRSNLAKRLAGKLDAELLDAEIIVGKIANDTTNPTITAYLNGFYGDVESEEAVDFAVRRLMPDRLKSQFCFLSEDAISCLEPLGVTLVEL